MAYLRHTVGTRGPAAPATVAVVARDVPEAAKADVEAELRELFPAAAWSQPGSSELVVLVSPSDPEPSFSDEIPLLAPEATIWCYPVDSGRVLAIRDGSLRSWRRQQERTARLESWGRRHRARWSLLGDVGRLVDRTLR